MKTSYIWRQKITRVRQLWAKIKHGGFRFHIDVVRIIVKQNLLDTCCKFCCANIQRIIVGRFFHWYTTPLSWNLNTKQSVYFLIYGCFKIFHACQPLLTKITIFIKSVWWKKMCLTNDLVVITMHSCTRHFIIFLPDLRDI